MTKSIQRGNQQLTRRIPGIVIPVVMNQGRLRQRNKTVAHHKQMVAPAFYVVWQEGPTQTRGFSLYTLMEDIPGHSQWSTVSGKTLVDAGFMLPSRETGREHARSQPNDVNNSVESQRTAA